MRPIGKTQEKKRDESTFRGKGEGKVLRERWYLLKQKTYNP